VIETAIGGARRARLGYELADVSLVPRRRTRDADLVDVTWRFDAWTFDLPVLGAPLDAAISPATAGMLAGHGGLGVLSLEGLWTRYEDPERSSRRSRRSPPARTRPCGCSRSTTRRCARS
jgi:IMP dehydrogenase